MDYMKRSLITASKETTVFEALETLKKNKIRQLPVVTGDRLIGLVTEKQLLAVSPSPATSLGTFEKKFFMDKILVSDVMVKFPLTVSPDTTIEEAALYLREHKVGSVPVVEGDVLVGIITVTDIFDAMTRLFGYGKPGIRILIESEDRIGLLTEVTRTIKEFDFPVKAIIYYVKDDSKVKMKMRLDTIDAEPVVKAMKNRGLKVSRII
ncbi:CBS and ACT domain-containing protein [Pelotomaculum propionicicum]|uniref:CBS and ACT domain-containing protein n=1 Tax=Pelotomaculum propionicicum TaxID=258475 RepID=UPI003B7BC080